jgi:coenzyme F420-reducing hydrogenase alpha subunit
MPRKTIKVENLARVEGEGALTVTIRDGKVRNAQLRLFEPPRFFEAFLRGRAYTEAPDVTARICGICPVAYQMSAVHAMEDALGITIDGPIRDLRRLLYCGEWIESHGLHIYMLHAPDFLGYEGAIEMAKDHPELVQRGLAMKKAGNELMTVLGGREIHPINVRVGGFYKTPRKSDLLPLRDPLERARDIALETVRWTATLDIPDVHRDYEMVALRHPAEYPLNEGRIVSSLGLDIAARDYDAHFEEIHVPHSTALQSRRKGTGTTYLVGPLARYSLNYDRLTPTARDAAKAAGLGPTCNNPYQGIIVRAVETLYACEEALRILGAYEEPDRPSVPVEPRAGSGYAATEAPRGLLYHGYRLDREGTILSAQIVPPTAQNQPTIEEDLMTFLNDWIDLPDDALRHRCEQTVRNYDPCISCATHFLDLRVDRG